jgi:hypothetical protein
MNQFASLGLGSIVVPAHTMDQDELQQWRTDWNFDPAVQIDATNASGLRKADNLTSPSLLLISPTGQVVGT